MAKMAKLERVLGCTACPSSFAIDQTTGMIAYAAGSTVVLITKNNGQFHFVNNSKNNITCITFSSNGKYLATGEFGNCPMVRVWEICKDGTFQGQQIAELKYHTLGVLCVKFTHDSTQLISVGIQHDKSVAVWDWRGQKKIAENRLTSQVNAMDISEDGNCFVTVGVRHVKFWMLNGKEKALSGRSAILAEQRNNTFLDICCASGNRAFALTDTRLLVEFFDKKIVNTFELTGEIPYSITLGPLNHLLIGFSNGHVRAINTETIEVQQLPGIPHFLHHDISTASEHETFYQEGINAVKANERFPDVKALLFHQKSKTLTALYSDRSIYQYLLTDTFGQSLLIGYRNHVGAILDLEMVPKNLPWLPAGTFMTSGVDATIRFWSLDKPNENINSILTSNILSPELKKVLFLSPDEKLLSDHADNHSGMIFSDPLDSTTGARCLKLSPDGRHLAAGFRDGNLGVFDITTDKFEQLISVEAHDGEMLCIEYADPLKTGGHTMLASGGRDRLIHLYDAENGYQHLATVEDHSSSVNSIKFVPTSSGYEMFTCATDKLVVIRRITYDQNSGTGGVSLERINQFSSPSGLNYLTTSPDGNLIGACQDRQLRTYTINGKMNKQIKGTLCEEGTLTKLALDPSGTYAATVCSDRYVYVIDISTGECAAVLNGQADCVTSIAFTPDCRRLVVVSHSGCVFVWRLSNMLTKRMTTKLGKTETSSSLTTGTPHNDRCSTPDSLIESGSDSASFIGSSKKDHPRAQLNASGSEFGSLTSIQITQDDDLDSGVGGGGGGGAAAPRQHPPPVVINDSEINLNDSSNFEIRRLPARSTKDLTLEGCEEASPNMLSTHPLPPASYASSRSMSNLHRTNASPQRTRRKWDAPEYNTSSSPNNGHVYQQPIQNPQINMINNSNNNNATNSGLSSSISLQGLRSHANYDSPLSGPKNSFAPVPQRIVPGTFTNSPTSKPHYPGQMTSSSSAAMGYYEDNFDRANASRNSLTKKFMNLSSGPSSLAGTPNNEPPKTVWTPQKYENNRRPSNLFNNFSSTPNQGIHRRQSEKIASVSTTNMDTTPPNNIRRLFQRNSSSNNISSSSSPIDASSPDFINNPNSIQLRRKPMDRAARRRLTVSAYADIAAEGGVSTPLSPGFPLKSLQEEDYEDSPLHRRSQSPSSLLLNLESEQQSRSRPSLRKNSEMGSTMSRITPSSSRSNLRGIGSTTLNKSSQALNKMLEAKEKLKKSQENLALQIGGEDAIDSSPTSSNSMARSRSIGNLRRTQDNLNNTFHGFEESGLLSDNKRQMARSVTSLHNGGGGGGGGGGGDDDSFRHPDEYTLQAQYGSNSRRQSSSRLADSIRNLQKLSNPDLTNEHLFEPAETSFSSAGFNDPSSSAALGGGAVPCFSTLPKSMRKGAVSKRVAKATAARLDQTSESDSNTSDQTPNSGNNGGGPPFSGSYIKSAGSGFLRANNGPLRSSSSVEAGRVAANRRMFDSGSTGFSQHQQPQLQQQRKPQNYLAQKINQQYDAFVGQDNGIIDESASPRSMASASFDVPMTDEHSKKMAMHLYECIEQFNTACDKILGARQLIDTDTSLTTNDREKLLKLVNKSILQGRGRLDNFDQSTTTTISSSSNRTTTLSGGTGSTASMGGPSHLASPSPTPSEPRLSIDANFINRYGPQIMHLLQENMSKQN